MVSRESILKDIEHWTWKMSEIRERRKKDVVITIVARDIWDQLMASGGLGKTLFRLSDTEVQREDGMRIRVSDMLPDGYGYKVTREALENTGLPVPAPVKMKY